MLATRHRRARRRLRLAVVRRDCTPSGSPRRWADSARMLSCTRGMVIPWVDGQRHREYRTLGGGGPNRCGVRVIGHRRHGRGILRPEIGLRAALVAGQASPPKRVALVASSRARSAASVLGHMEGAPASGSRGSCRSRYRFDVSGNDLLQPGQRRRTQSPGAIQRDVFGDPRRFARIARRSPAAARSWRWSSGAAGPSGSALYEHCGLIEVPTSRVTARHPAPARHPTRAAGPQRRRRLQLPAAPRPSPKWPWSPPPHPHAGARHHRLALDAGRTLSPPRFTAALTANHRPVDHPRPAVCSSAIGRPWDEIDAAPGRRDQTGGRRAPRHARRADSARFGRPRFWLPCRPPPVLGELLRLRALAEATEALPPSPVVMATTIDPDAPVDAVARRPGGQAQRLLDACCANGAAERLRDRHPPPPPATWQQAGAVAAASATSATPWPSRPDSDTPAGRFDGVALDLGDGSNVEAAARRMVEVLGNHADHVVDPGDGVTQHRPASGRGFADAQRRPPSSPSGSVAATPISSATSGPG